MMTTGNAERFVNAAVDSVLQQTFENLELIVVDDGSTDCTAERLRQYADERLQVILQPNQGYPAALNAALRAAQGVYPGFLDGDDVWLATKLARHIEFMERHPEADLTFSWSRLIAENGEEIGVHSRHWRGTISFRELLADFVIGNSSSLVLRRSALDRAGWLDPELPRFCDMDLCLRVALLRPGNVHAIPEELTLYRRRSGQMSRDREGMRLEWSGLLGKFRRLAPEETAAVVRQASSNMTRYFAYLAYENDQFREAGRLLWEGFRSFPTGFLADSRNWKLSAASLAGLVLPRTVHRRLERLAGVSRDGRG
jgi:glycosyltransferase involved in cell wall biosynthesis